MHQGKYEESINDANRALQNDSSRADIYVFTANVYSWSHKNDSALIFIEKAKKMNYLNDDFYSSYLNILLRSNNYQTLAKAGEEAEKNGYSNTKDLLTKQLIAYRETREYEKGIKLAEQDKYKQFLANDTIDQLYTALLLDKRINLISILYSLDMFDNVDPHHLVTIGYSRKISTYNTFTADLYYANRFSKNDFLIELNDYWTIYKKNYLQVGFGYASNANFFPRYRMGIEYFFMPVDKWEASLGGRYMNYPNAANKDVFIFTGSIGNYFGNNWLSIRPFYVLQNDLQSLSVVLKYRLYGKSPMNFWGLEAGVGNSPDDILTTSQSSFNELMSYHIKVEKNFKLNRISDFNIRLGYMYEQINQNSTKLYRNRYMVEAGYKYRF
ncbi:MAG: YaiO family outer membrane beta-barrel protein [Paludibacteraceae bacterium]|nr:YaiO family outer membrane beta-barrel protein [Paludibacteraceae bacterium]